MPSGSLGYLQTSGDIRDLLHLLNVGMAMKILSIVTLVAALGAVEEAIQPCDGRESFDMDFCLVFHSNVILASTCSWEADPTLRALIRSTGMMVRYWIEK